MEQPNKIDARLIFFIFLAVAFILFVIGAIYQSYGISIAFSIVVGIVVVGGLLWGIIYFFKE